MIKHFILITCYFLFSVASNFLNAQVVVTNPGNVGPTALSATYSSLASAITALNSKTSISGPVTITLNSGNAQTAPNGGYVISAILSGASATNAITFEGNGNIITAFSPQTSGSFTDAVFEIRGADFITIQNFVMQENAGNTITTANSNNMTEWGVALLYTSTTNGAQNITIKNNTISLNRNYQNTFGIYSNSTHSATSVNVAATATGSAGRNSGTKVYGNNINNVNNGIVIVGPTAAADFNTGIDIGGSGASTANTLSNFGTTGTFSSFLNVTGSVFGILIRNSVSYNVSYNNVTSSNGGTTSGNLRGIYVPAFSIAPTGTITNTINNNSISVTTGVAAGTLQGVTVETTTGNATTSLTINNNNFLNSGYNVASPSGSLTLISNAMANLNTSINNNTFTNLSVSSTGSVTFISNNITVPSGGTQNVNSNSIVTAFNKTGVGGTLTFITNVGTSGSGIVENWNTNNFSNITVSGSTIIAGIVATDGGTVNKTISGNTINSITGGTGTVTGISCNNGGGAGGSGNIISNNTITNISGGNTVTGISIGSTGTTYTVSGNTITNLSSTGGSVTGISGASTTTQNYISNIIGTLSSTFATGIVTGIVTSGATTTVSKNKIYDLSGNQSGTIVNGINITGGTTHTLTNNIIGNLIASSSTSNVAISGVQIGGGSAVNVYHNTVFINSTTSSVSTFGTSAIYVSNSTPVVTSRNNIFINTSAPGPSGGFTAAFRYITAPTASNYNSASNNNLFFVGSTSVSKVLYGETGGLSATNGKQTLFSYKSYMGGVRDSASVTENLTWQSTSGSGNSFLKFDQAIPTQVESGGKFIATVTDDYVGTLRSVTTPDIGAWELTGVIANPMVYVSSQVYQLTNPVCVGSSDNGILRLEITTTGSVNALTVTDFTINGSGTSNLSDVASYRIYYTSTSSVFNTTNPIIPATTGLTTGNITVVPSSTVTLATGTNYFWLVYNMNATTSGANLDGRWTSLTLSSGPFVPVDTNPSGVAKIRQLPVVTVSPSSASYCIGGPAISLTASGATFYSWTPTSGITPTTGNVVNASPVSLTTYTVIGTDTNGCVDSAVSTIAVNTYPLNPAAIATPSSVCWGATSTLTALGSAGVGNYIFSSASGVFTPISAGTPVTTPISAADFLGDTKTSTNIPIGFAFNFDGILYTSLKAMSDGYLSFNPSSLSSPVNNLSSSSIASRPIIAPLWDDLDGNVITASASYKTTGSPGSRIFTIEWINWQWNILATGNTISFQVKLYEANGKIEFIYQQAAGSVNSGSASIGIAGADTGPGNFLSLNGTGTTPLASSITETTTLNTKPANGQVYTFIPGSLSFTWSPPAGLIPDEFSANPVTPVLTSDTTYTVIIDHGGCTKTASTTITVNPLVCSPATVSSIRCSNADFTVTANISGGAPPYSYSWFDSNGGSYPDSATITANLPAATYTFICVITDVCNNTCSSSQVVVVNPNPVVSVTSNPLNALICDAGSVTLTASGANTYSWSPASGITPTTGDVVIASPLATTIYTVVGKDINNCTSTQYDTVTVAKVPVNVSANASPSSICSGGTSILSASASPPSPFTVKDYTFGASSGTVMDSMIGAITIVGSNVDDAPMALSGTTPGLSRSIGFDFTYEGANYTHFSASPDGWIKLGTSTTAAVGEWTNSMTSTANIPKISPYWDDQATGTTGNVKFLLKGSVPNRILIVQWFTVIPRVLTNPATSIYQAWLYESNGKIEFRYGTMGTNTTSTSAGLTGSNATDFNSITFSTNSASTITADNGQVPGSLPASGTMYTFIPPASPYTYSWVPSSDVLFPNDRSTETNPLSGTTVFTVTVSNQGCTASASVIVSIDTVQCTPVFTTSPNCANRNFTVTTSASGGVGPYSFTWSDGVGGVYPDTSSITANLPAGNYIFTCTVQDACMNTCTSTSALVVVTSNPIITVTADPQNAVICETGSVTLTATGANSYTWNPVTALSPTSGSVVTASPSTTTNYVVTGTALSGCVSTASQTVTVSSYPLNLFATATPAVICPGNTSLLFASASSSLKSYSFASSNGTFTPIAGGTQVSTVTSAADFLNDTKTSKRIHLGFKFNYEGVLYDSIVAMSDGYISFNPAATSTGTNSLSSSVASQRPLIAPLWDDLDGASGSGSSKYITTGAVGSRIFIIEWLNWQWNTNATGATISFQVRLYEASGKVEFIYRQESGTENAASASIGITGVNTGAGNFLSLNGTGISPASDFTIETSTLSIKPATGQVYSFIPLTTTYSWDPPTDVVNPNNQSTMTQILTLTEIFSVVATSGGCSTSATTTVSIAPLTCFGINSTSPNCANTNFNLSVSTSGGAGNLSYSWSDGQGGIYPNASTITANVPAGSYTFTCIVTDACGTVCSSSLAITVNTTPVVSITSSPLNSLICGVGSVTLTANGTDTYSWSPTTGLTPTIGNQVSASPVVTTTYTVTSTNNNGCTSTASRVVNYSPPFNITGINANPSAMCSGGTSNLNVTVLGSTKTYSMSGIPIGLITPTGTTTSAGTGDDAILTTVALPFTVSFFGNSYTSLYIHSNGFVSFSFGQPSGSPYVQAIPNSAVPDNFIAISHDDLNVNTAGAVKYFTNGTSPNRIFVIDYNGVKYYNAAANNGNLTGQIQIYEADQHIEIHIQNSVDPSLTAKSLGIENVGGTLGYAPFSRNSAAYDITTPEAWRFSPANSLTYSWTPAAGLVPSATVTNPTTPILNSTTTYSVTITDPAGCTKTGSVTISASPLSCSVGILNTPACTNSNFQISAGVNGGGPTINYSWSDGQGGVYPNSSTLILNKPAGTYNYTCQVTDNCGGNCSSSITVTVRDHPVVTLAPVPASSKICGTGSVTLNAAGANTYTWNNTAALIPTSGSPVSASPSSTTIYVVTGTDNFGCTATATQPVTVVNNSPVVSVSAIPNPVCEGSSLNLSSTVYGSNGPTTYSTNVINGCNGFVDISVTGTSVGIISNDSEHNITLPFAFVFNEVTYTNARVGNNGVLVFGSNSGDVILTNACLPVNNFSTAGTIGISAFWDDLFPGVSGSSIKTQQIGSVFYIQWTNESQFNSNSPTAGTVTFQIQLEQFTNKITLAYQDVTFSNASYDFGTSATVGLNFSSVSAIQYSCNTNSLADGRCIVFTPSVSGLTYNWNGPNSFTANTQNTTVNNIVSAGTGIYSLTVMDAAGCSTIVSTPTISVKTRPTGVISGGGDICPGENIFLSINVTGTGPWSGTLSDGTAFGGSSNPILVWVSPVVSTTYSISALNANGCNALPVDLSGNAMVNVNPDLPLDFAITASVNPVCAGSPVTLTVTATNGGDYPYIEIYINSNLVQSDSTTTYTYIPSDGDAVLVLFTSNATGCVSNNPAISDLIINVSPVLTADVTISASNDTICMGTPVTFTAAPINGGAAPNYKFFVNSILKQNGLSESYTYTPTSVDTVYVIMTSSETCVSGSPKISNTIITDTCTSVISLNIKMFVEGFYTGGGQMNSFGAGGCLFLAGASPDPTDADIVMVSAIDPVTKYLVDSALAVMKTNGDVSVSFSPPVQFGNYYYIKVNHRNSIETWSATPVLFTPQTTYDFTISNMNAYGNNMIDVGTLYGDGPKWAFYSGDIVDAGYGLGGILGTQDGIIESSDYSEMENAAFITVAGYMIQDITGDLVVESLDYSIMENNLFFSIYVITP